MEVWAGDVKGGVEEGACAFALTQAAVFRGMAKCFTTQWKALQSETETKLWAEDSAESENGGEAEAGAEHDEDGQLSD